MKKSKLLTAGMAAIALTFGLVLAGCGGGGGGGGGRAAPASDFSYDLTEDGKGIKITGYTGNGGALVIPSTIEDMPVTEIGDSAFQGSGDSSRYPGNKKDAITSVFVPDSVTVIGGSAFSSIVELTKATLPDGLKIIPGFLFSGCDKLTSVNLPSGLEMIDSRAFGMCGELNEVIIPSSLTSVRFVDADIPNMYWDKEKQTNITPWRDEPDNSAFYGCGKLPIKTRQAIQALGYTGNDFQ